MAKDLTVVLEDRPGTLATLGEATGKAGINLEGICGFPSEGKGMAHILARDEDAAAARRAFEDAGLEVRGERDVLVVDIEDKPGEIGRVARRIADAGLNIDLIYMATATRLVVGAENLEKARAAVVM